MAAREQQRVAALYRYELMDTPAEPEFDEVAQLAADICGVPMAIINLVADDCQFFKAEIGMGVRTMPVETSFCAEAVRAGDDLFIIEDAAADARFAHYPQVKTLPNVRFYAGALLKTRDGHAIGSLGVMDTKPHTLSELQRRTLKVLAHQVMYKLELRLTRRQRNISTERYKALFDSMDEGFCIIQFVDGPHGPNSDYVHIEANAAYAHNTGIPNVVGQYLRQMVPDEADGWAARYRAVLETGAPIHFEQELVATGRHLSLSSFRIEPPELKQVAVLFQDVTARKKAEQELKAINDALKVRADAVLAERRVLADVMDGASAVIQVVDMEGRWLAFNRAAVAQYEKVLGFAPKVGMRLYEALAAKPDILAFARRYWDKALAGGEFTEIIEFTLPGKDTPHFYETHFSALRDDDGKQIGVYEFVYDVTERMREQRRLAETETALRQVQKMEAVGQLTGGIAHDFNNLLAGISGSLEMIGVRLAQGRSSDVEKYLSAAQGATRKAGALTHRLLAFSRQQTLSPRPIIVNRLLSDLSEMVRRTVGPSYEVDVVAAAGLWPTLVDENQLENAILNLCINARDAMKGGGKITLETSNKWLDGRAARERDLQPGQYVSICVSDTGIGMSKEVLERVFDPFFTTKPLGEGTGLGLSMVYGFVRQSNGQVRIYTEVGKGTTVCIYLPRYNGAVTPEEEPLPLAQLEAVSGETVLVVDDEAIVRMLIVDALAERGYACREAGDGPEALKYLEKNDKIDLLITDVGLPGGMNGRQVAEAARRLRPGLRVLFVTGYAENAALNHGHIEPGMDVLTKPFAVTDLTDAVGRLLHAGGGK